MKKIKIAIADDYKIFREGLKVSLGQDDKMQVIFEAENGEELITTMETKKPDIIIMDLKMPIMDGMEATQFIRKKYSDVKVLVVSMYEDDKFIIHLMEIGANGYLLKNAEPEEIRKAIFELNGFEIMGRNLEVSISEKIDKSKAKTAKFTKLNSQGNLLTKKPFFKPFGMDKRGNR